MRWGGSTANLPLAKSLSSGAGGGFESQASPARRRAPPAARAPRPKGGPRSAWRREAPRRSARWGWPRREACQIVRGGQGHVGLDGRSRASEDGQEKGVGRAEEIHRAPSNQLLLPAGAHIMDPPVSDPVVAGQRRAASAVAEPALEPPGTWSSFQGFRVGP